MNHHDEARELPELSDDAVRILYSICADAAQSAERPFKALFDARNAQAELRDDTRRHDGAIFQYLMRLADEARHTDQGSQGVDFVQRLKDLLAAQGITLAEGLDDLTKSFDTLSVQYPQSARPVDKRRSSFDDAHIDERWLNDHSERLDVSPSLAKRPHLPHRTRDVVNLVHRRRPGSTASEGDESFQRAAHQEQQLAPPSPPPPPPPAINTSDSEAEDVSLSSVVQGPSSAQLEQNAEVFSYTSDLRRVRESIKRWRDLAQSRTRDEAVAQRHDQKTLLKQAWDAICVKASDRRRERLRIERLERQDKKAFQERNRMLLEKAFTNWAAETRDEMRKARYARERMLKWTYFRRWQTITIANLDKTEGFSIRRMFNRWHAKSCAKMSLVNEAEQHYELTLLGKYKGIWFHNACEVQATSLRNEKLQRLGLGCLFDSLARRQYLETLAADVYAARTTSRVWNTIQHHVRDHQRDHIAAQQHAERTLMSNCFSALRLQTRLAASTRNRSSTITSQPHAQAFQIWKHRTSLSMQALALNDSRLCRLAWTGWNNTLRRKALTDKINERLMFEALQKLILRERLQIFQHITGEMLLARMFKRLNAVSLRRSQAREEAEDAAADFRNRWIVRRYNNAWKTRMEDLNVLDTCAADARMYMLCSATFHKLKNKSSEHKVLREKELYAKLRYKAKAKLVGRCFDKWREQTARIQYMNYEADRRLGIRTENRVHQAFTHWVGKTRDVAEMTERAIENDRYQLCFGAFSAIVAKSERIALMEGQAEEFRNDSDLVLLASVLKRLQWMHFTATRRTESAEALWTRNQEQHVRGMFRHWSSQAAARHAQHIHRNRSDDIDPIDSPSLRPASRLAPQSNDLRFAHSTPFVAEPSTPGYLRTPFRSQLRAGRFRPLRTPAALTPMAFDTALISTTPVQPPPPPPAPRPPAVTTDNNSNLDARFSALDNDDDDDDDDEDADVDITETPAQRITPFSRKLSQGGFTPSARLPSALRTSLFGRGGGGGGGGGGRGRGLNKSVQFE